MVAWRVKRGGGMREEVVVDVKEKEDRAGNWQQIIRARVVHQIRSMIQAVAHPPNNKHPMLRA